MKTTHRAPIVHVRESPNVKTIPARNRRRAKALAALLDRGYLTTAVTLKEIQLREAKASLSAVVDDAVRARLPSSPGMAGGKRS